MKNNFTIEELIPQRKPFVFIDKVIPSTNKSFSTTYQVKEDAIFYKFPYFREAGILENIAQTAAAFIGYYNREEPKIGVIGAVKNFKIYELPMAEEIVNTNIEIVNEIFDMFLLQAKVYVENRLMATCEMKVAIPAF